MKLSPGQVQWFWRLWADACKCQRWTPEHGVTRAEVEDRRKDLLACYGFASLHDVDRKAGFDAIKAALLALQDSVTGAVEADHPEIGEVRRIIWHIREKILPVIGAGWPGYVTEIMQDRGWGAFVAWDVLTPAQLEGLVVTLSERARRMAGKAQPAPQTCSQSAV